MLTAARQWGRMKAGVPEARQVRATKTKLVLEKLSSSSPRLKVLKYCLKKSLQKAA